MPGQRRPSGAIRNLLGVARLCSGRSGRLVTEVGVQPDSSASKALAWAYGLVAFTCHGSAGKGGADLDAWIRPLCALVVAGAVAYASYIHQRELARLGGVDTVSASLWPLSDDSLFTLGHGWSVGALGTPYATRAGRGVV